MTETSIKTGSWNWWKALPWYWKIVGLLVVVAVAAISILQFIKGFINTNKPVNPDEAHNQVVDNMRDELVAQQEALRARREALRARLAENAQEEENIQEDQREAQEELDGALTDEQLDDFQRKHGL